MGKDFIERKPRYCLWLMNADPSELKHMPGVLERLSAVKQFRLECKNKDTVISADTPGIPSMLRYYSHEEKSNYVAIPKVSSSRRRYIPMEMVDSEVVAGDKIFLMPRATLFALGVLQSNVHMAWTRQFCGRLKSDFSYSSQIVYNAFPWPDCSQEQKEDVEKTAQAILDARALYPESSLADLYDELTMPIELRKAHQANDRAVMKAYGFPIKDFTEEDCVAELMKMYQKLVEK